MWCSENLRGIAASAYFYYICNINELFANMDLKQKTYLKAWALLLVFVPMLLVSSLHIHDEEQTVKHDCKECVSHNCAGHLLPQGDSMHTCVLCQFLTMSFLTAVGISAFSASITKILYTDRQNSLVLDVYNLPIPRGPPSFV